jgi:hypothetical protein
MYLKIEVRRYERIKGYERHGSLGAAVMWVTRKKRLFHVDPRRCKQ